MTLTRRTILNAIPLSIAATAIPAGVLATNAIAAEPEHPWAAARRHAKDLSAALAGITDGEVVAVVEARGSTERPVSFVAADYYRSQWRGAQEQADARDCAEVDRLIDRHRKAWLAFNASVPFADEMDHRYGGVEAESRSATLDRRERKAFAALIGFPAVTAYARKRKATYLLTSMGTAGRWMPNVENVALLLNSLL